MFGANQQPSPALSRPSVCTHQQPLRITDQAFSNLAIPACLPPSMRIPNFRWVVTAKHTQSPRPKSRACQIRRALCPGRVRSRNLPTTTTTTATTTTAHDNTTTTTTTTTTTATTTQQQQQRQRHQRRRQYWIFVPKLPFDFCV